jgi:hypothetical protein
MRKIPVTRRRRMRRPRIPTSMTTTMTIAGGREQDAALASRSPVQLHSG